MEVGIWLKAGGSYQATYGGIVLYNKANDLKFIFLLMICKSP
jgi:hypothetical protein